MCENGGGLFSEDSVLAAARRGDRDALQDLCRREWRPVYAIIYASIQDRADAEDLTQEVFLRALRHLDRYRESGAPFRAYLAEVARNLVRDRWRRRKPVVALEQTSNLESSLAGPERSAEQHAEREQLKQALMLLRDDYRMVVVLRVMEGRSSEETAQLMRRTPEAVRQLQHRALIALRANLVKQGSR